MPLTLAAAQTIATETLAEGRRRNLKPLAVVVLDAGGHMVAVLREDGASNRRVQVALGKVSGALALGISSRKIAEMAADRPTFVASLGAIAPDGVIPAAGGVLLAGDAGEIVGAVGVSGDTSDNDEACALAGIAAAGLAGIV